MRETGSRQTGLRGHTNFPTACSPADLNMSSHWEKESLPHTGTQEQKTNLNFSTQRVSAALQPHLPFTGQKNPTARPFLLGS